jgi:hypothetical protein
VYVETREARWGYQRTSFDTEFVRDSPPIAFNLPGQAGVVRELGGKSSDAGRFPLTVF